MPTITIVKKNIFQFSCCGFMIFNISVYDLFMKSVAERESTAEKSALMVEEGHKMFDEWRKNKNYLISNLEFVLTLSRGQIEVSI